MHDSATTQPSRLHAPVARWPRAILFDLDGTLIDSLPDITTSVAELFALEGLSPLTSDEVRPMIGHGLKMLVQRAYAARGISLAGPPLDDKTAKMAGIYARHLTELTTILPGVRDALAHYANAGIKLAVVTNKTDSAARTVLSHFGVFGLFAVVIGDIGLPRKPEPDMLLRALSQLGEAVTDAVMVGDSDADAQAARAAGMPSILVRGGYSTMPLASLGADQVIDSMADLTKAIDSLTTVHARLKRATDAPGRA
jgi:phosphoglycolate phosphatase